MRRLTLLAEEQEKGPRRPCLVSGHVDQDLMFDLDDVPEWLAEELDYVGFDDIFLDEGMDWERQALELGLCPGQRIVLLVHPPHYFQYHDGEWDAEYSWQLYWRESLGRWSHAASWRGWLFQGQTKEHTKLIQRALMEGK